ncbi:hypothetical protein SKAU_G00049730 [Synaphobranchus kaupii]|uniref:Uncharacterized protein n=1 Tax=Synaphobranchus kaupii TaxID=118154 RepID=A0A9Q1G2R5_SYNKA|nr:hypothetical protein SKAU_G00049730 [Synaphobranchus kaupii]
MRQVVNERGTSGHPPPSTSPNSLRPKEQRRLKMSFIHLHIPGPAVRQTDPEQGGPATRWGLVAAVAAVSALEGSRLGSSRLAPHQDLLAELSTPPKKQGEGGAENRPPPPSTCDAERHASGQLSTPRGLQFNQFPIPPLDWPSGLRGAERITRAIEARAHRGSPPLQSPIF